VKGVDGVPSHISYDPDDQFLYIADTGNKRIVRLDTNAGTLGGELPRRNEPLAKNGVMNGTTVEPVVPPGVLEEPSGLKARNGHVYVSDTATSRFYCFDKTGKEIRRFDTGLPPQSLAGFTFGVDNKLWFVDRIRGKVLRLDPAPK
jgi:DNA-binding beta-propeller fold protein YncE